MVKINWKNWHPLYIQIVQLLDLDEKKDIEIGKNYYSLLRNYNENGFSQNLEKIYSLNPSKAWVFGAGPSLEKDFDIFLKNFDKSNDLIIAADGSSLFLIQQKVYPHFVFSDLDGSIDALIEIGSRNSFIILHAHGDNFSLIKQHLPGFIDYNIVPTIQTEPIEPYTFNFGGFTDGDRAVSSILEWFPMITVNLLGFTFGNIQGRFSKPNIEKDDFKASKFKLIKLNFAKVVLAHLASLYPLQIINYSRPTEKINGIPFQEKPLL